MQISKEADKKQSEHAREKVYVAGTPLLPCNNQMPMSGQKRTAFCFASAGIEQPLPYS